VYFTQPNISPFKLSLNYQNQTRTFRHERDEDNRKVGKVRESKVTAWIW
jgi:hypothetical protein